MIKKKAMLALAEVDPVFADQPAGLRRYARSFHGFGEALFDYHHRQPSPGLTLFPY